MALTRRPAFDHKRSIKRIATYPLVCLASIAEETLQVRERQLGDCTPRPNGANGNLGATPALDLLEVVERDSGVEEFLV